jgi:hypothetical protein
VSSWAFSLLCFPRPDDAKCLIVATTTETATTRAREGFLCTD